MPVLVYKIRVEYKKKIQDRNFAFYPKLTYNRLEHVPFVFTFLIIAVSTNRGFLPAALRWLGLQELPVQVPEPVLLLFYAFW